MLCERSGLAGTDSDIIRQSGVSDYEGRRAVKPSGGTERTVAVGWVNRIAPLLTRWRRSTYTATFPTETAWLVLAFVHGALECTDTL